MKELFNVVLFQDSVEQTRQPRADISELYKEVLNEVTFEKIKYKLRIVSGSQAVQVLRGLTPENTDLLLFSSNAMIRRDGEIFNCFEECGEQIQSFLRNGGSLVIFHQGFAGVESDVKALKPMGIERFSARDANSKLTPTESIFHIDHPILTYPYRIEPELYCEDSSGLTRMGVPFGYFTIEPSEGTLTGLVPIIELRKGQFSFASFEDKGRAVFCAYPADWASDRPLLVNIFSFAIFGMPKTVFVREGKDLGKVPTSDYWQMMRIRLSRTTNMVELSIDDFICGTDSGSANSSAFVLKNAKTILVEGDHLLSDVSQSSYGKAFLARGGVILSAGFKSIDGEIHGVEKIQLTLGAQNGKNIDKDIKEVVGLLSSSGWFGKALIHDLRDVLLALHSSLDDNDFCEICALVRNDILTRTNEWFNTSIPTMDPGTALTAAWVNSMVNNGKVDDRIGEAISSIPSGVLAQDFRILKKILSSRASVQLADIIGADPNMSWGHYIRCLDTMRMIAALGNGIISESSLREELSKIGIRFTSQELQLIDRTGANVAALLTLCTVLTGWKEGYGKGARRSIAEIASVAKILLANTEKIDVTAYAEDEDHRISDKVLLKLIFALSINKTVDEHFPSGVATLVSNIAEFGGIPDQTSSLTRSGREEIAYRQRLAESYSKQLTMKKQVELIARDRNQSVKTTLEHFGPWIVTATVFFWLFVILIVALNVILTVATLRSFIDGGDGLAMLGALLAALPVSSGVIVYLASRRYLSINPRKTYLEVELGRAELGRPTH